MACDMFVRYLNREDVKNKKYLYLSLTSVLVGLLLIFNPGGIIYTYLRITGIYLIVVSVLYFVDHFKLIKK